MKKEEISQLLAEKFKRESHRLKSWGTKTDDKAAMSFAMAVSEFVRAMMADSRKREARRILNKFDFRLNKHSEGKKLYAYINERIQATSSMAKAIQNLAIKKEGERAWKPKIKEHKHKHHHRSKE